MFANKVGLQSNFKQIRNFNFWYIEFSDSTLLKDHQKTHVGKNTTLSNIRFCVHY